MESPSLLKGVSLSSPNRDDRLIANSVRTSGGSLYVMKQCAVVRWSVLAVIVATAASGLSQMTSAERAGLDFWNMPQLSRDVEESVQESNEMQLDFTSVQKRIAVKEQLMMDLFDGSTDLVQVAARFCELNVVYPDYVSQLRLRYRGLSDEECICRNVIDYAEAALKNRPDRTIQRARLEEQFRRFRGSQSGQRVPT